jgi:hypothetical protein
MTQYNSFIARAQKKHGSKFDSSALAEQFIPYFNNQQRIEVDFGYEKKRGYIGVTGGWKPCFLLMLRTDSIGSSYTLRHEDKIIQTFNKYRRG